MSTLQGEPTTLSPAAAHAEARPGGPRAWAAIACHTVVDYFQYLIIPLMPLLATRLDLTPGQKAAAIGIGGVASGIVQPGVAWLSDKLNTRWLGTLGLILAAISTSLVGYTENYTQLLTVQIISSMGIGAFHPVAAAAVGQLYRSRRSLGVSLFFLGGMTGGIAGNLSAPTYVKYLGLHGLAWLIIPGLIAAAVLIVSIHTVSHRSHNAHAEHAALSDHERRWRWIAVGVLYVCAVIRFTVNAALVYLFIDWCTKLTAARDHIDLETATQAIQNQLGLKASSTNGLLQAAMQIGMGSSALAGGWLLKRGSERRTLIILPIFGAATIALMPWAEHFFEHDGARHFTIPAVFTLATLAGIGFGGLVPVTIALAQRLLPHRTSLASGLMMGGAWAVAGIGPTLGEVFTRHLGSAQAYFCVAGLLLIGGLISTAIPGWLLRKLA